MRAHIFPARFWRYVVVGVAAFSIGGGAVAQAVAPGGILGNVRLADRTDETHMAAVDADGNVQVKVNNLASTQQVSGTVSVNNFPATQNVSGTVTNRPAVATKSLYKGIFLDAGKSGIETFTTINASFVQIESDDSIIISVTGPIGNALLFPGGHVEYHYTQRVPINSISVLCENLVIQCFVQVLIIGD